MDLSWLDEEATVAWRDPLWGHVYLSQGFQDILASPACMRLHRIRQLGPCHLVYPGATHSRFAHSIGVYRVAKELIQRLAMRPGLPGLSLGGIRSFLAAALLHDLGHFPYTHSLKELDLADHESLTARLVSSEPLAGLLGRAGADPYLVAAIVDKGMPVDSEGLFYRGLLSGPLDPDKLDYLNRDAFYCGVPYGTQDVDFILSRAWPDKERGLAVDSKGLGSLEHLIFAKYLMYRSVYWHRDLRAATAMMKEAVYAPLLSGALASESLYGLDDEGFIALMLSLGGQSARLAQEVREGRLHRCLAEFPYDPGLDGHRRLEDLAGRGECADLIGQGLASKSPNIARRPGPGDIIVDLPEPLSFEAHVRVVDDERDFSAASLALGGTATEALARSLRLVRVYARAELGLSGGELKPLVARLLGNA